MLAFRKDLANLTASVALHYAPERIDRTLRCARAMASGVSDRLCSIRNLVDGSAIFRERGGSG